MARSTALPPLAERDFGFAQAQHLLLRAGFGGSPGQVASLASLGLEGAVNYLVDYEAIDPGSHFDPRVDTDLMQQLSPSALRERAMERRNQTQAEREQMRAQFLQREAEDRQQMGELERWWLGRLIESPRPLEEKLALLWHGHFASNHRTVRDSYLMLKQNQMFRQNAKSFPALARGIVRDPAMLKFLNNDRNIRRQPNENLARELMELFTLGEGRYAERDIKEGARALTGYGIDDNDFAFHEAYHDTGRKTILGKSGDFDGDDFVNILLNTRDCARWVARKLVMHFVADEPQTSSRILEAVTDAIVEHKGELAPVLRMLFASQAFYEPQVVAGKIKSPAELVAGTVRSLQTPVRSLEVLADAMDRMGQKLFDPPSVAGWDGGQAWVNSSTLFARQNTCVYLLTGKLPYREDWDKDAMGYDPLKLLADMGDTSRHAAVVDRLLATLLADASARQAHRASLLELLDRREGPVTRDQVTAVLLLITAAPAYQLC